MKLMNTKCPRNKQKSLIDRRTKGLCSIVIFSFDFKRKSFDLDFETKFVQIRYELTEIKQHSAAVT